MTQQITSESTSKPDVLGVFKTIGWTLACLTVLDLGVNYAFPYPKDPLETNPPKLALYFEYGRSIEGKLTRMVGETEDQTALIARAGWLDDETKLETLPTKAEHSDGICVASYGMSFTEHVVRAAQEQDPRITLRERGGPAAPLNHSYALFVNDLEKHEADIAVLGILASSFPAFQSQAHMTWNFEFPSAYTYPHYEFQNGELTKQESIGRSLEEFRKLKQTPAAWQRFRNQLASNDAFFDPILFSSGLSDNSAVARMLRRGWWQSHKRAVEKQLHTAEGFVDRNNAFETARYLVVDFAAKSRTRGMTPIVLVFNDRGYSDHLYQILAETLEEHDIAYLSTHETAPASDLSNFIPDGHFRPDLDQEFGEQLRDLIANRVNWPANSAAPHMANKQFE